MILSVSDVVKLASAGVKCDLTDLKIVIERDENFPQANVPSYGPYSLSRTLDDAFWDRWQRAHVHQLQGFTRPYLIHAHEFAETVYVMVCPPTQAPFIIEDRAPCYPSDALMAALSLYESTNP